MKFLQIIIGALLLLLGNMEVHARSVVVKHCVDHVDLIHINHFYDNKGKKTFDQIIFYNWGYNQKTETYRYDVIAWRLQKSSALTPNKRWEHNDYILHFKEGTADNPIFRTIYGKHVIESWTQYDPELRERNFLRKEDRLQLSPPYP